MCINRSVHYSTTIQPNFNIMLLFYSKTIVDILKGTKKKRALNGQLFLFLNYI